VSTSSAGSFVTTSDPFQAAESGAAPGSGDPAAEGAVSSAPVDAAQLPEGAEKEAPGVSGAGAPADQKEPRFGGTSSVAAEAQQGDGPAAASASGSAVGENSTNTSAVSVVVGPYGAAAASDIGVVVVGAQGAAAACEMGAVSSGPSGVAASGNGANSSIVAVNDYSADGEPETIEQKLARLQAENQELRRKGVRS